jgi:putative ABC transport system permease protein
MRRVYRSKLTGMNFLRSIIEGTRIALHSIWTNKVRAALTTFGIIIGIVAVTSMSTMIDGVDRGFERSLEMLGRNVIFVQKWPWGMGGEYKWWEYRNRPEMDLDYVEEIQQSSRYASAISAAASRSGNIRYESRYAEGISIQGATTSYTQTASIDIADGRFFSGEEDYRAAKVVVLGASVSDVLFENAYPLGKEVRIGGQRFLVIGVMEKQGKFLGLEDMDNRVIIPIQTYKYLYGLQRSLQISVQFPNEEYLQEGQYEIEGIMRRVRQLDPAEKNDFAINKPEAFRQQYESMTAAIYGIGIFLTALSLFVGGIGVMNIMFVSVKERTKEIGIRKAVGATSGQILVQFLIEAVVICMIGGGIGVGLSVLTTQLINQFFVAYMDWGTVLNAVIICTMVGLGFGFMPAWRAAKSDPIESLRYE